VGATPARATAKPRCGLHEVRIDFSLRQESVGCDAKKWFTNSGRRTQADVRPQHEGCPEFVAGEKKGLA
jgi:hypothetical protein